MKRTPALASRRGLVRIVARASVLVAVGAALFPTVASAQEVSGSTDVSQSTNVAPVKDGRCGSTFTVYKTAATSTPLGRVVNCKQIFGRAVFVVIEDQGDWLKVKSPVRANGGIGFVEASIIDKRFIHDWRITISVKKRELVLTRGSEVIMTERVVVGAPKTPTPLGSFYTVDLLRSRKPKGDYGPYAYGLSGFSPVYQKFGTGDGRLGIHGTNKPGLLGTAASNGCVRLSNAAITKMKGLLPLGVPVDVVA